MVLLGVASISFSLNLNSPSLSTFEKTRHTAAASRALVLKQVLQLPKPLWREIMELMGGDFSAAARRAYEDEGF